VSTWNRCYNTPDPLRRPLFLRLDGSDAAQVISNVLFSSRLYPFNAELLVAGVDPKGGSIFSVDFFGSVNHEKAVATESGSRLAYGLLESEYREGMTAAKSHPIAAKAMIAATRRNVFTGDYYVAVLDKAGFREISEQEKEKLLAQFTTGDQVSENLLRAYSPAKSRNIYEVFDLRDSG
jgi:20S proteasome alpha/beta subunit